MAKMDDRMELIGSAILSQAQQEARDLIDKANVTREQEISSFEDEIVDSMFGKVQSKATHLRLESVKTIARDRLEAHRALLSHRTEKTAEVFAQVRSRLLEYAATLEYQNEALTRADAIKDEYDHTASTVFVRESDMALAEQIVKRLGNTAQIKTDPKIRIGGFKLRNSKAHILVDETLDERLEEQRLWFLQNCGLRIV